MVLNNDNEIQRSEETLQSEWEIILNFIRKVSCCHNFNRSQIRLLSNEANTLLFNPNGEVKYGKRNKTCPS